jgi:hypothetical protein
MALIVVPVFQFSLTTITMVDMTGAYNVTTNPTGYGSPNPAFTDYAHYAIIRKKNVNSVADSALTLSSYNPITDVNYSAPRAVDGWYQGTKLNILIWTAGTYASGTVRYYSGVIYQANTSTSSTPGADGTWTVVTDLTTIEANASVVATVINRDTAYNADVYWSSQIAELTKQGNLAIEDDDRDKNRLDTIYRTIQQVLVADQRGNNTAGEWCVLRLQLLGAK